MELLEVKELTKTFGGLTAVDHVSFVVLAGQIKALIGPNGAGKTTIFNMLCGIYPPTGGEIYFGGRPIAGMPAHKVCSLGLGRTFQTPLLFSRMTVLENVMVGLHSRTGSEMIAAALKFPGTAREEREIRLRAMEILKFIGLGHRAGEYPGELPYGQQRLLEIGRAVATDPKLLLLDEPAAGLNEYETEVLAQTLFQLRDSGITILLVEHDMGLVMKVSDQVAVLNYGEKIAEGTPAEVQKDPGVVAAYLGEE